LYLTILPSKDPETTIGVGKAVVPLAWGKVVVAAPATPVAAPTREMAKMVRGFILQEVEKVLIGLFF
jgi:hypothetical protein